ncbi:MAG: hypothetical protein L6Q97_05455 [Thermoanaerobaculia bacterium]|nr:hypothetical protein [Thermoanaerobaculia bacterium]
MDAPRYKKLMLDRFQEHVQRDYEDYCRQHGLDHTNDQQLLTFLIDHELIPSAHIQRYTVRQEFERVFPQQDFHKTHTVLTLAHRFSIPERTVWSILKGVKGRKKGRG